MLKVAISSTSPPSKKHRRLDDGRADPWLGVRYYGEKIMRPQPLIAFGSAEASSRWYQRLNYEAAARSTAI